MPPPVVVASPPAAVAKTCLPKLNLAKFRGDVTAWVSFCDSFKSAVHENSGNIKNSQVQLPAFFAGRCSCIDPSRA